MIKNTIIITAENKENTINKTIQSCLNQTYKNLMKNTLKKNLEMRIYKLLVYDCLLSMVNGVGPIC